MNRDLPIAYADRELKAYVGSKTQLVRMSAYTGAKQIDHHPDVAALDYSSLDAMLATGEVLRKSGREVVIFAEFDGKIWQAVLKRAGRDNRELFLATFHRANENDRSRAREAMTPLRAQR